MAKKKSKAESPFLGRWRLVSVSQWEDEYLDEEVEAYIEFDDRGGGSFQFGYIQGVLDSGGPPGWPASGRILVGGQRRCRRHAADRPWLGGAERRGAPGHHLDAHGRRIGFRGEAGDGD